MTNLEFNSLTHEYRSLIKALPITRQAGNAKFAKWNDILSEFSLLKVNQKFIDSHSQKIRITRQDLIDMAPSSPNGILHILIWGYPTGGRGKNIKKCLEHIDEISKATQKITQKNDVTVEDLIQFEASRTKGLGPSTWTKILSFNRVIVDGNRCCIYDDQIKQALNHLELDTSSSNYCIVKPKIVRDYLEFNKLVNDAAHEINAEPDQVEVFLFFFTTRFKL